MNTFKTAWLIAKKDLRGYFRDRPALILGFMVPLALVTVFGWLMGGMSGGSKGGMPRIEIHVVDEDQTESSRNIVDQLRNSEMLKVVPAPDATALSREEVEKKIADGDASHALVIPKGFRFDAAEGNAPKLVMIQDPGREMEQNIIQIGVMQAMMGASGGKMWVGGMRNLFADSGLTPQQLDLIEASAASMNQQISDALDATERKESPPGSNANEENATGAKAPQDNASQGPMAFMSKMVPMEHVDIVPPSRPKRVTYQIAQSVSGVIVMMLMFSMTGCGSVLLAERENGTLKRLFGLPIPRRSVLLSKFLFTAVVGLIQMAVLLVYGEWMFRVGLFRDPLTLLVLVVSWVAAASAFGIFVAAAARSSKQADSLATVVILVMAALGGCWFPLQLMQLSPFLDLTSKSMMTYWAMSGFQGLLWNQLDLSSTKMLIAIGLQWCWALGLGALSLVFFRRNYCRG